MKDTYTAAQRRPRRRDEQGSASIEAVLMMPLLIAFLLLYAALQRGTDARALIDEAAGQAARAATLGPATTASARAVQTADATLGASPTCPDPDVTVKSNAAALGGSESVQITCHVPLADLALPGTPGHLTLTGTATAPRDPFTEGG